MKYFRLLAFIAFLCFPVWAKAQFYTVGDDPGRLKWYSIETPEYRIIYPAGLDSLARVYGKLLEKELRQREEINELIMTEDCIEMTCHLRYCPQCQGDPLSLLSVLGCNFYDDHETEHHHEPANESSDEDETQTLSM